MRARPLLHCFGHIHEGWGAERVTWSENVDEVARSVQSLKDFKSGGWREGMQRTVDDLGQDQPTIAKFQVNRRDAVDRRGAFIDMSAARGGGLKRGEETLMVNAAIMNVMYRPNNAPWIVDIDLPKAS